MRRGRKFFPPPDRDGIWFSHRGADNSDAGTQRTELTSTGDMLSAPFKDTGRPRPPPKPFNDKARTNYRAVNPFSSHDNRNVIQRYESMGDGRKPLQCHLQHTERYFLMHHCRAPTLFHYETDVTTNYTRKPASAATPRYCRFPRLRPEPHSGPLRPLPTTTTDWNPDSPRSLGSLKASSRVLALCQRPFLKPSSWKYAYSGLPAVYPP